MQITVDNYTRLMLTVIAVLLTVVACGLWFTTPTTVRSAQARLPDAGLQRQDTVEALAQVNNTLKEIEQVLLSGKVKVQIVEQAVQKKKPATTVSKPVTGK